MTNDSTILAVYLFSGPTWFRQGDEIDLMRAVVGQQATLKADQKSNANMIAANEPMFMQQLAAA